MFRLEKVFQNDDKFFITFSNTLKFFFLFILIYVFSILENNSIYELSNFYLFKNSIFFEFSFIFILINFLNSVLLFKSHNNFFSFYKNAIKREFLILIVSLIVSILTVNYFFKFIISINLIFLLIFLSVGLLIILEFNKIIYNFLVDKNIIQKNIFLIGTYKSIKKILSEDKNKIYVYKCCILIDKNSEEIRKLRTQIKIPIFDKNEDVRSLLEYHSLGQIWILKDNEKNFDDMINLVVKFSVDIIILNFKSPESNLNYINGRYSYEGYEVSKFYGFQLLLKVVIDKFLSLFFILVASPFILLSILLIYLEDGFPLIFTQDRTGWDGRRFKIYKLRSLKNIKFKKTEQVQSGDQRLLKIGKFIRRFSIDELPQFINVLKGDMSIVGPRPHMVEHDIYYSNLFKEFLKRHKTIPGITGWAQINGFRGPTRNSELMRKRMELDLWYLNNWSLFLDLNIILKTFFIIFKHKGV